MKLNSKYLNKCYYVAAILQYNDELKREGFKTEAKKMFLFGGETFTVDLFAQRNGEKRIYDFQTISEEESKRERTATLNKLAKSINASPFVIFVDPPVEKQIVFDELCTIINDYFVSGGVPSELSELSDMTTFIDVKVAEILTVAFEKELITLSGSASINVSMRFDSDINFEQKKGITSCEDFPLTFNIVLDLDYNYKTFEYEIDTSGFVVKHKPAKEISDNKNYISKTRFDMEFKLFQDLSETVLTMTSENKFLFPAGLENMPKDDKPDAAYNKYCLKKANESFDTASKAIKKYAPFIPKKLFNMLEDLKNNCRLQINWYGELVIRGKDALFTSNSDEEYKRCISRTSEIDEDQTAVMDFMRTYLENLDVK